MTFLARLALDGLVAAFLAAVFVSLQSQAFPCREGAGAWRDAEPEFV